MPDFSLSMLTASNYYDGEINDQFVYFYIFVFNFCCGQSLSMRGFCDIKITPPSINLRLKFSWNNFVCYELLLGTQIIFPLHYGVNLASTLIYLIVI